MLLTKETAVYLLATNTRRRLTARRESEFPSAQKRLDTIYFFSNPGAEYGKTRAMECFNIIKLDSKHGQNNSKPNSSDTPSNL